MVYYLDYAAGILGGQTIKQAGYGGTIRYVTSPALMQPPNPGNPKHITRSEYESHLAAGLDVWLVYQGTTTDADGGYEIGRRNALRALEGCLNENHSSRRQGPIGYSGPIFFTNDRTTLPSPSSWRQYLDGAASVIGFDRVGAYGFGNAMDAALGHANYFWQAGRRRDVRSYVHFWQDNNTQVTVGGKLCDRNLVLKVLQPPVEPPVTNPPEEESDMQLTDIVGHRDDGTPITVGDALKAAMNPSISKGELEVVIEPVTQHIKKLSARMTEVLEATAQTTTWGDLETKTWGELETSTWGKIN
jgi:hypothetical protein